MLFVISFQGSNLGYRSIWRRLRSSYRIQAKQVTVMKLMRLIDPEGVRSRSKYRLRRRKYLVPGPNYIWHVDGYDKLKRFGFAIHGCIDGFSRHVLWLKLGTTNNKPEVVAHNFVETILENGCVPTILRVDAGTENPIAGLIQQALRHHHMDENAGEKSYIVGPSTANQRIERYWGEVRANAIGHYMDLFKTLVDKNLYNHKNPIQRELIRFCFAHLIDADLQTVKNEWNSHRLRAQTTKGIPAGIPNILYNWPTRYGALECKKPALEEDVLRIKERFTIQPEFYDAATLKLVRFLVAEATTPRNSEEAYNLYILLMSKLEENISEDD